MLIVVGLMAFGLLAIGGAVFLAMGESKTPATSTATSSKTESSGTNAEATRSDSTPSFPIEIPEQRLPALREEAQIVAITTQFSELTVQLRSLHEQAREVERRLSILADIAEQITPGQSRISIEEAEDYRLPESVESA
jgi:hypothetical protein